MPELWNFRGKVLVFNYKGEGQWKLSFRFHVIVVAMRTVIRLAVIVVNCLYGVISMIKMKDKPRIKKCRCIECL